MSTARRGDSVDTGTTLSMDVIDAIADHEGVDPVDLDTPLYAVIDLDALDALAAGAPDATTLEVTFRYEDYDVRVTSNGDVEITEVDAA